MNEPWTAIDGNENAPDIARIKQEHAELVEALGRIIKSASKIQGVAYYVDAQAVNDAEAILEKVKQ